MNEHPLFPIFLEAIDQCTKGKGGRHGGDRIDFLKQPWLHYGALHGRGFLTGQAAKKIEEAASTKYGDEFVNEALGAIVYIGMSIIHERNRIAAIESSEGTGIEAVGNAGGREEGETPVVAAATPRQGWPQQSDYRSSPGWPFRTPNV